MTNEIRIYKSFQAEELDRFCSGSPEELRAKYETALRLYDDFEGRTVEMVTDLAGSADVPWNQDVVKVFAADWATGGKGTADRGTVLVSGYREAIRLALDHEPPLPIQTFWVTGAGDEFEVHVSDGTACVTLFMVVPPGKNVPNSSLRAEARSWVVTAAGRTPDGDRPAAERLGEGGVVKLEVSGRLR